MTYKLANQQVDRIVDVAKAAAPDKNYASDFALGALQVHAANWLFEMEELREQVEKLKTAIREMRVEA